MTTPTTARAIGMARAVVDPRRTDSCSLIDVSAGAARAASSPSPRRRCHRGDRRARAPRSRRPARPRASPRACGKCCGRGACTSPRTATSPHAATRLVRVTHPFHPLNGRQLVCVGERYNRYGTRLLLRVDEEHVCSVPRPWTELVAPDPKVVLAEGRAPFRVVDLLELADLVSRLVEGEARPDMVGSPQGLLPGAPTEPDVRNSRIRLFETRVRYARDARPGVSSG